MVITLFPREKIIDIRIVKYLRVRNFRYFITIRQLTILSEIRRLGKVTNNDNARKTELILEPFFTSFHSAHNLQVSI